MIEIWKDIPGYEGKYQVSTLGRVKSLNRFVDYYYKGAPRKRYLQGHFLKPRKHDKYGHLSVLLGKNGPNVKVHQLVMKTFVGEPKKGQEVRHINGVPADNRLENLKYGTRSENIKDIYLQGKRWRKLTLTEVSAIKDLLKTGSTPKELAEFYRVSIYCVRHIRKGDRHGWI